MEHDITSSGSQDLLDRTKLAIMPEIPPIPYMPPLILSVRRCRMATMSRTIKTSIALCMLSIYSPSTIRTEWDKKK
jgi:hypothetical protein